MTENAVDPIVERAKRSRRWLHLGCGSHQLPEPWENSDREVDLRQRLPFAKGSVQFVLLEHVIEHLSFRSAMALLSDIKQVLQPGGVLRLCFPDATLATVRLPAYAAFLRDSGALHGAGDTHVLRHLLLGHNHQSAWSFELARAALEAVGFVSVWRSQYGKSDHPELRGVDGHHHEVGLEVALCETRCLEAEVPR